MSKLLSIFILLQFYFITINAQSFFRFEADYSIKEKSTIDSPLLNMGKLYFDLNKRAIIYEIKFPEKEIVIMNDTAVIKIIDNEVTEIVHVNNMIDFSIFSLLLNGQLSYFGLKNTVYTLSDIEKDQGMVITTWLPPESLKDINGKMLLSQINNRLNGLISFDTEENIISKQFFKEYVVIDGLDIPTTVTQFFYTGMDETIKLTTYKNIKINNLDNEEFYNYNLPAY